MPYKDPEKRREYQKQYRECNRDKLNADSRERNREWYKEVGKKLRQDDAHRLAQKESDAKHYLKVKKPSREELRRRIVEYLGGKCQRCGLVDDPVVYDCHHLDPAKKDMRVSSLIRRTKNWERILVEVDKCVLLCSNCHRKEHYCSQD